MESFNEVPIPVDGGAIQVRNNKLLVPDNPIIPFIEGDGVGPDVIGQAIKVLEKTGEKSGLRFEFEYGLVGGAAIDATGDPLPAETVDICRRSGAVLLGAVGGPKWDNPTADKRPEQGLLRIRKELSLFANIRPIKVSPALSSVSVLK